MNDDFFVELLKIIGQRRPSWSYVLEDTLISLTTNFFAVDWGIINEIEETKKYKVEGVSMHTTLGQVITIRYIAGA